MAESKRKFYRNTFLVEVLTEEPIGSCPGLDTIQHQITDGAWNGEVTHLQENRPVRARRAAKLLQESGSDPEFFRLTPEGEDMDQEDAGEEEEKKTDE